MKIRLVLPLTSCLLLAACPTPERVRGGEATTMEHPEPSPQFPPNQQEGPDGKLPPPLAPKPKPVPVPPAGQK